MIYHRGFVLFSPGSSLRHFRIVALATVVSLLLGYPHNSTTYPLAFTTVKCQYVDMVTYITLEYSYAKECLQFTK